MLRKSFIILGLCLFLVFGLVVSSAFGASVNLAWDHPNPSSVSGYKLHFGSISRVYTSHVDAGNVLASALNVGVGDSRQVFIGATAYDAAGNESGYSNEVVWTAPDDQAPGAPTNLRVVVQLTKASDGTLTIGKILLEGGN